MKAFRFFHIRGFSMRKIYIAGLLAASFLFVGCSSSSQSSLEPVPQEKAKTQKIQSSPIGSWGTAKGKSIEVTSKPWMTLSKDETFKAFDSCYMAYGTWTKSKNTIDISPISKNPFEMDCEESWVGKIDSLKIEGDLMEIRDFDGQKIESLKLVSRDALLVDSALSGVTMQKGADIANCIAGQNVSGSEANSKSNCQGKTHESKNSFKDSTYQKRFGKDL